MPARYNAETAPARTATSDISADALDDRSAAPMGHDRTDIGLDGPGGKFFFLVALGGMDRSAKQLERGPDRHRAPCVLARRKPRQLRAM